MSKTPTRAEWGRALESDDVEFVKANSAFASVEEREVFCEIALTAGNVRVGKYLLEEGGVSGVSGARERLLAAAAGEGQLQSVKYLLGLGVDDLYEELPLVKAATSGSLEVVQALLDAGADVNQGIRGFENALDVAVNDGFQEVAELLRKHGGEPGRCVYPSPSDG